MYDARRSQSMSLHKTKCPVFSECAPSFRCEFEEHGFAADDCTINDVNQTTIHWL